MATEKKQDSYAMMVINMMAVQGESCDAKRILIGVKTSRAVSVCQIVRISSLLYHLHT